MVKRLLVFGIIACAVIGIPREATRAQTPEPTLTPTPTASPSPTVLPTTSPTPVATPPTLLDPKAFALSAWYFQAPTEILASQVESNDMAASEQLIFHFGPKSFADEGRITGYFMNTGVANLDRSGNTHVVITDFLVSSFPSADAAAAAFAQQRDGWEAALTDPTSPVNGQVVPIGQQVGDQEARGIYVATASSNNGPIDLSELLFRRGPYLVEIWQDLLHKDENPYGTTARKYALALAKTLDTIAQGLGKPKLPKPGVRISLQSVRFEPNNTKDDLKAKPLTRAKRNSTIQMGVYFALLSAPPHATLQVGFHLTLGRRSVDQTYKKKLGSYPPDYYHDYVYDVQLVRSGTYHLTITVKIKGVTERGTAAIKVS